LVYSLTVYSMTVKVQKKLLAQFAISGSMTRYVAFQLSVFKQTILSAVEHRSHTDRRHRCDKRTWVIWIGHRKLRHGQRLSF
jgi:hypothetical protein